MQFFILEDEFKRKWNTLRTQFSQERTKLEKSRKSGAGIDEVYVCKWTWFEQLKFLIDIVGPKKSISNLPLVSINESNHFPLPVNFSICVEICHEFISH